MNKPEYFSSQIPFYTKLKSLRKAFDINASLGMSRHSFCDTDGKQYLSYSLQDFVMKFNEAFGKTINPAGSQIAGSRALLISFYDVEQEEVAEVAEEIIEEDAVDITPEQEDESSVIEEDTTEVEQEAAEDTEEESEYLPYSDIDWPRIEALKGSAADKLELDQYAEKFGISLKRNKKLENMLADFKEAVGV